MGSSGAAWHQWKKHGRCSGQAAPAFFALSREAYAAVTRPEVFRKLDRAVELPASVVEEAFLEANPWLEADMVTVTCNAGRIQEVRLCLDRDMAPRRCGADVRRDCRMQDALLAPLR
jgi:ribonuclease T2